MSDALEVLERGEKHRMEQLERAAQRYKDLLELDRRRLEAELGREISTGIYICARFLSTSAARRATKNERGIIRGSGRYNWKSKLRCSRLCKKFGRQK